MHGLATSIIDLKWVSTSLTICNLIKRSHELILIFAYILNIFSKTWYNCLSLFLVLRYFFIIDTGIF